MDATCTIQDSIHVFSLVHKYVSRILGTYHTLSHHLFCICKVNAYAEHSQRGQYGNILYKWSFDDQARYKADDPANGASTCNYIK